VQTTMKEIKMLNIKNSWQKWSIKNHNLCEENTILYNFNILIIWSPFILVLCSKHNFHWIIIHNVLSHLFPIIFCAYHSHINIYIMARKHINSYNLCRNPTLAKCGVKPNTSKVGDLESSGTSECSELDSKAQNTSHRGVLGVIGKVLKRRYRKWPRIGHLDICSPSYGQKKGQESNCQFDSRPQKVGNRPLSDLRIESAIRRWKDLDEGYKFGLDLVAIRSGSRELWPPKVPGLHPGQFRDNFGTPTWESREKEPFGCSLGGVSKRILYGGRWWLPSSPGRGVSRGPKCPWLVPTPKGVPECELTTWVVCFDADSCLIY
jgi:hypothetical protein